MRPRAKTEEVVGDRAPLSKQSVSPRALVAKQSLSLSPLFMPPSQFASSSSRLGVVDKLMDFSLDSSPFPLARPLSSLTNTPGSLPRIISHFSSASSLQSFGSDPIQHVIRHPVDIFEPDSPGWSRKAIRPRKPPARPSHSASSKSMTKSIVDSYKMKSTSTSPRIQHKSSASSRRKSAPAEEVLFICINSIFRGPTADQ